MRRVVIPGFRKIETSGSGEGGTTNYNDLENKPSINNVPLVGNLKTVDLKLADATLTEEGVPAEAKTVGQKLEEHTTSLTVVKEELTKKANISDIPTKVSELQNDSNYQTDTDVTATLTNYATKTYVGEQISSADHLKREIVTEIPSPETADKNTIYMIKIESATGNDKYREYLLIDGTVQCVGDTSVDLTDYAKKAEIPTELPANGGNSDTVNNHTVESDVPVDAKFTDTIYDDTEVKGSINELNSNLSQLEFGEVAGGKNLFKDYDIMQSYTISSETYNGYPVIYSNHKWMGAFQSDLILKSGVTYTISAYIKGNGHAYLFSTLQNSFLMDIELTDNFKRFSLVYTPNEDIKNIRIENETDGGLYIACFQIEKGITATDYEPYIPSVKMLADEVNAQNESLADYGLDNKSNNEWKQGYYDEEFNIVNSNGHICIGTFTCNGGDLVNIKTVNSYKQITVRYDNGSVGGDGSTTTPHNEIETIVPSGITSFGVYVGNDVPITPSDGGNISVYVNSSIEQLKNDLDKLNSLPIGSIIQIEADKDNIETTTQKYGWQYLGTSNIECNDGSLKLLVTNVYRKNN